MKKYDFAESENHWKGFLYDKDCQSEIVRSVFVPGQDTEESTDPATVAEARDDYRTVVTSNGEHFIRYACAAQNKDNQRRCGDCWGLVILPNQDFVRQNALRRADIKHGIRLGGKSIPWKVFGYLNLCAHVHRDGSMRISKFERCEFCQRDFPVEEKWYLDLPFVRPPTRPVRA
jgi:hypothetical protein